MTPDMALVRQHLMEAGFQIGVDEGYWGIENDEMLALPTWPYLFIWIAARHKPGCPNKYHFRFDVAQYPVVAPNACPWDMQTNLRLPNEKWPNGGGLVTSVFNPGWNPNALYAPCDRLAIIGHNWSQEFPDYWWNSSSRLEKYLHFIYTRLQSKEYVQQ